MAEQRIPELWWSPTECMVYADREGAAPRYLQMRDTKHFPRPADAVRLVAASSPLPDSETEWGRRWPGPNVVQEFGRSREDAENACYPNTQLVRREVGPWIEVQS